MFCENCEKSLRSLRWCVPNRFWELSHWHLLHPCVRSVSLSPFFKWSLCTGAFLWMGTVSLTPSPKWHAHMHTPMQLNLKQVGDNECCLKPHKWLTRTTFSQTSQTRHHDRHPPSIQKNGGTFFFLSQSLFAAWTSKYETQAKLKHRLQTMVLLSTATPSSASATRKWVLLLVCLTMASKTLTSFQIACPSLQQQW